MPPDHPVSISFFRTDLPAEQIDVLAAHLSAEEKDRASRYHKSADRGRAIISRACLRFLLASRLAVHPASIRFQLNSFGKPFLAPTPAGPHIGFNVSHSGDWAAIAIAPNREVGIDIERWDEESAGAGSVDQYFSKEERRWLRMVPPDSAQAAFYNLWTAKESVVKAIGKGLSIPLDSFFVLPSGLGFVPVGFQEKRVAPVFVYSLSPCPGYSAAVAICGLPVPRIQIEQLGALEIAEN